MNEKELKAFKASLDRKIKEVKTSKKAARQLLESVGMLTPSGKLKKSFQPAHVSR